MVVQPTASDTTIVLSTGRRISSLARTQTRKWTYVCNKSEAEVLSCFVWGQSQKQTVMRYQKRACSIGRDLKCWEWHGFVAVIVAAPGDLCGATDVEAPLCTEWFCVGIVSC